MVVFPLVTSIPFLPTLFCWPSKICNELLIPQPSKDVLSCMIFDILFDIYSDILLFGISSDILPGILSDIYSSSLLDIFSDILSGNI